MHMYHVCLVCSRSPVVKVMDLRPRVASNPRVGLASVRNREMGPMSCFGFGRPVKQRTTIMRVVVDFGTIHGNEYTLAAALAVLV